MPKRLPAVATWLLTLACALPTLAAEPAKFRATQDGDAIVIDRFGSITPLVTQQAKADFRPYLHPIMGPDGVGELTQFSPGHHRHQTGLYWGFTRVNGRDYFHHPKGDYWRRKYHGVLTERGTHVRWNTTYEMLDAEKKPVLVESQTWTLSGGKDHYVLDLMWEGKAAVDVTIAKYSYGGLFLRMPWSRQTGGEAVNSEGQKNSGAEGKRTRWVDVGMPIKGRDDWGRIVIMDHPSNDGHPNPWRVDGQLGVGPCRARLGSWSIPKGKTATIRYRLLVYTGKHDAKRVEQFWKAFAK